MRKSRLTHFKLSNLIAPKKALPERLNFSTTEWGLHQLIVKYSRPSHLVIGTESSIRKYGISRLYFLHISTTIISATTRGQQLESHRLTDKRRMC